MSTGPTAAPGAASAGLLEEWMKAIVKNNAGGVASSDPEDIIKRMKDDLRTTWEKLGSRLKAQEAQEIRNLCFEGVKWAGKKLSFEQQYMGDVCMAIAEVKYFMSGLKTRGKWKAVEVETPSEPHEWYPRCIVGSVALSEIYGDHCKLKEVIGEILQKVDRKIEDDYGGKGASLSKCKGVGSTALIFGRSVLGDTIKSWTKARRDEKRGGGYRVGGLWDRWEHVCKQKGKTEAEKETKKKELRKENADTIVQFMKMGNTNSGQNNAISLAQTLMDDNIKLSDDTIKGVLREMVTDSTNGQVDAGKIQAGLQKLGSETQKTLGINVIKRRKSDKKEEKEKKKRINKKKGKGKKKNVLILEENTENCIKSTLDNTSGKSNNNTLCKRLGCMKYLWQNVPPGEQGTIEDFWNKNVQALWKELAGKMKENGGTGNGNGCNKIPNATHSEKTACKYLHAGLKQLYENPTTAKPSASPTGDDNKLLSNPSFRQTMGCLLLHSYAKHMKSKAACNIEKGITEAFKLGEKLSDGNNGNCSGKGPCVPCQWNDTSIGTCTVKIETTLAKTRVEKIVQVDDTNTTSIMGNINKMNGLCDHMKCLASRVNSSPSKSTFWEKTGEVGQLWKDLSNAMTKNGGQDSGNGCDKMDSGSGTNGQREATNPEKRACKHLTAGFNRLKEIAASDGNEYPILFEHPSLKKAVGCFLLHAYANKMREDSTCVIDSGLKKAFDTAGKSLNEVECKWDDDEYEGCNVKITTNSNTQTEAKTKVQDIVTDGTTVTDALKKINEINKLCDYIKCAAPNWFKQNEQVKNGTKKDWCQFWEEGVRSKLEEMFQHIEKDHAKQTNGVCESFGDGNPQSVERKACNHITAGLEHLKTVSSTGKQLLDRAVGCFALNMYADQIIEQSNKFCPIDESKINEMFKTWNANNKISCQTSAGNTEDCSVCDRVQNSELTKCQLSVDSNLVDKTKGTCSDNDNRENVQPQMKKLLEDKDTIKMEEKVSKITDITKSSLCTQLQCAAKKWNTTNGMQGSATWNQFWTKTGDVGKLWIELSNAMTKNGGQDSGNGCNQMDNGTNERDATTPEKKACLHLSAGFNQLKEDASANSNDYPILSTNPSLRQTVGCILLKEYAKKMQNQSTCVITSGLEKAFKSWKPEKNGRCASGIACIDCNWDDNEYDSCDVKITTNGTPSNAKTAVGTVLDEKKNELKSTMDKINDTKTLCQQLQCAAPRWFERNKVTKQNGTDNRTWCEFWNEGVKPELTNLFTAIQTDGKGKSNTITTARTCQGFGYGNTDSVERKACNYIAAGLQHIKGITGSSNGVAQSNDQYKHLLARAGACIALNMYADQIREKSKDKCPIDESKIQRMFDFWNAINNNSCLTSASRANNKNCFVCKRLQGSYFADCNLSVSNTLVDTTSPQSGSRTTCTDKDNNTNKNVSKKIDDLLKEESKMEGTLKEINKMNDFCTQLQCAARKWKLANSKNGQIGTLFWSDIHSAAEKELTTLLHHMTQSKNQEEVAIYCSDKDANWYKYGHKQGRTNKAACLLFAAGLKHIYVRGKGSVKGPSFEQTMGCLFLKEYAKQLKDLANEKKQGHSWVHPYCSIDKGITHAFNKSKNIMEETSNCNKNVSINSCFVCTQNENDYKNCHIGSDSVKTNVESMFNEETNKDHMQQTLENTVCPILLTDILTPFLPLAPVSIGLSAMAYYLWKYFGPLGKGGARFRRSPAEIPGSSVQEQVLDHVQQDSSHEYRLVKERKPRSAPTRTKRSGRANRRTIIEIHFEVLDECQKGDTQLNQKDFLELLVQEFMGSELMEEEQVLMEGVPMERVPIEEVPMERLSIEEVPLERVPSLGSGFMV
ncbi:SICAvar, type I [Plasmodium knowlesi strain H]|uniref:SICAvar, type I n=1 Tax=Plasmodium knowlesi (strain H) TaxID=5851 RepID=A0A1A7W2R5_PLAKH|nr:SICAvar, type I [Plasmodium knowlesi strain H]